MTINKFAGAVLALSLLAGPVMGFAQTATTSSNTQVQAMLAQILALQAQIKAMQDAQKQLQTAQTNVQSTLGLIRTLKQGMSGDDVSALQAILAADPTIYPEGSVTGFYGRLTAEAVKKFQKKNGLESVGNVGPKTLKRLNEEFGRLGLSFENSSSTNATSSMMRRDDDDRGEGKGKKLCAKVPPGHLIAPGWNKHREERGEDKPLVPPCQILPPGISNKGDDWRPGTTTTPTPPPTPTPDTTAPIISFVGVNNIMGTTTNTTWMTNELSNSRVWFGTSSPVSTASSTLVSNTSLVLTHLVPISGLATSTTYYYVVVSSDASGNTATSSQNSFVTTSGF